MYYRQALTNLEHSQPAFVSPYAPPPTTAAPGLGGHIGPEPADFIVDEIPAYAFDGEGEHWLVQLRKIGVATPDAVKTIARAAGVRDAGVSIAVNRVVFMADGQIVEVGTPEHFFVSPHEDRTRAFLSKIL